MSQQKTPLIVKVEQGLTSHQTHYRSYRRRFLQVIWPNQWCQSTEGNQLVLQKGLNPTRTTQPRYNKTTLGNCLYAWRKGPDVTTVKISSSLSTANFTAVFIVTDKWTFIYPQLSSSTWRNFTAAPARKPRLQNQHARSYSCRL